MCKGYLSNISFYSEPIGTAIRDLETNLVAGINSGEILEPLIEALGKKIDRYTTGIKQIKTVYVPEQQPFNMFSCCHMLKSTFTISSVEPRQTRPPPRSPRGRRKRKQPLELCTYIGAFLAGCLCGTPGFRGLDP